MVVDINSLKGCCRIYILWEIYCLLCTIKPVDRRGVFGLDRFDLGSSLLKVYYKYESNILGGNFIDKNVKVIVNSNE